MMGVLPTTFDQFANLSRDSRHQQRAKSVLNTLTSDGYPCFYAGAAYTKGLLAFECLDSDAELVESLSRYLDWRRGRQMAHAECRTAFMAIFPARIGASIQDYRDWFWKLLNDMAKADDEPWPSFRNVPPTDHRWMFCFKGEPFYVFGGCPAYEERRSRRFDDAFVVTFVPRSSFNGIERQTKAGNLARATIRSKLKLWDFIDHGDDFGSLNSRLNEGWRTYFVDERTNELSEVCPFKREPN